MMTSLRRLQDARVVHVADACYVTKDERGRIRLHQSVNTTARGAIGGAVLGSIVGAFLLNPIIGVVAGLTAGAVAGRAIDLGISDGFMRELVRKMEPRRCAVFVLLRRATVDRFRTELARHGGRIIYTSLSTHAEQRLRDLVDGPATRSSHARGTAPAGANGAS